jgi:hypothetical protein
MPECGVGSCSDLARCRQGPTRPSLLWSRMRPARPGTRGEGGLSRSGTAISLFEAVVNTLVGPNCFCTHSHWRPEDVKVVSPGERHHRPRHGAWRTDFRGFETMTQHG